MILGIAGMPTTARSMSAMTELETSSAAWESVANEHRNRIELGVLSPSARIDSQGDLCEELEVSRITVRRAWSELAREGLVHTRKGQGTFVSILSRDDGIPTLKSIGLVLRDMTSPFFVTVAGGIERYAYEHGFSLLLSSTSGQMGKIGRAHV